jgi:hypothetical protein
MANGEHPAMQPVELARPGSVLERSGSDSAGRQLAAGHHTVLALSEV